VAVVYKATQDPCLRHFVQKCHICPCHVQALLGLRGGVGSCHGGGYLHRCVALPLEGGCVAEPFGGGFSSLRGIGFADDPSCLLSVLTCLVRKLMDFIMDLIEIVIGVGKQGRNIGGDQLIMFRRL